MKGKMLQRMAKGLIVLVLLLLATTPVTFAQEETPVPNSEYYSVETQVLPDGTPVNVITINGPPEPPLGFERPTVLDGATAAAATLDVPAFDWSYGCSATSAAMIAAYYDRTLYPNMYTGPGGTPVGVMPEDNSEWGAGECPLSATHQDIDGRGTRGHVDDYWIAYNQPGPDPYDGNWTEHTLGDCTGDYMNTNKWYSDYSFNIDGATRFYYYASGQKLHASTLEGWGEPYSLDGTVGFKQFYESRGYEVIEAYYQVIDEQATGSGFTYTQYQAEIDAGRPVMIHVTGHTMVGVGYDDSTVNLMYVHDTWDYNTYTMEWNGEYGGAGSGFQHEAVTIVRLAGGYYSSVVTGDWDAGATWGTGNNPAVPGANSGVTVNAGHTVIVDGDERAYNLAIESGGTVSVSGGASLTIDGDLSNSGGNLVNSGTLSQTQDVNGSLSVGFFETDNYGGVVINANGLGDLGSTMVNISGNQDCTTGASGSSVRRCLDVVPTSSTGLSASLRFYFSAGELGTVSCDNAQLWHWNGSVWEVAGTLGSRQCATEPYYVEYNDIDSFSPFVVDDDTPDGGPTAVTLTSFEAAPSGAAVLVTWETAMEIDTIGFNVWRSTALDGGYVQVNESLIPSRSPGAPFGAEYTWLDEAVEPGVTYYYKLEDIAVGGESTFHGPISVSQGPNAISVAVLNTQSASLAVGLAVGTLLLGGVGLALVRRARRMD